MNSPTTLSGTCDTPYVRQRHWNLEPLVFALCLVVAVLALNHPISSTAPQQATPTEPVRTLASAQPG